MTFDRLRFHFLEKFDAVFFSFELGFPSQMLPSFYNSIHQLRLQQIIKMLQLKCLMQEPRIHIISQPHQSYCLISNLSNKCPVIIILCSY